MGQVPQFTQVQVSRGRREPSVDRRRFRHDPLEGARHDTKASRYADAFDPRKLLQVRALAADDRDVRPVDLPQTQHVAHPLTILRACRFLRAGGTFRHVLGDCGKLPCQA